MSNKTRYKPARAHAVVTITMELDCPDTWGPDCSVSQVHAQAKESALGLIRNKYLPEMMNRGTARIIGAPTVRSVIVDPER